MPAQDVREYEYDVCLSFAGENRSYIDQVAEELKKLGVSVFYDKYEQTTLWGKDLYVHLAEVYSKKALYCVMFVSQAYKEKLWTNHERQHAQARAFQENREYILPVRFDDTEIPGLAPTVGYLSLRDLAPEQLADEIKHKVDATTQEQAALKLRTTAVGQPQDPIEQLQEYLVEDRHRIKLYQLIVDQRETLVAQLSGDNFSLNETPDDATILSRIQQYEELTLPYVNFVITGCRWGTGEQASHWVEFLERVANTNNVPRGSFYEVWRWLALYPALILLYGAGLACVATNRYDTLAKLFQDAMITDPYRNNEVPAVSLVYPPRVLRDDIADRLPGERPSRPALNNRLFNVLQRPVTNLVIDERRYPSLFDRFEFMLSASNADVDEKNDRKRYGDSSDYKPRFSGPLGRFAWRMNPAGRSVVDDMAHEAKESGAKWLPLTAGMFNGSLERLLTIHEAIVEQIKRSEWY